MLKNSGLKNFVTETSICFLLDKRIDKLVKSTCYVNTAIHLLMFLMFMLCDIIISPVCGYTDIFAKLSQQININVC